jgi:hypothetical protein
MTRQGSCWEAFPGDDKILDRLAGLAKVIPPPIMEQALIDSGRSQQRACRLDHRSMLWVVLAMGLLTHLPIRQVYKHARKMRQGEKTPARSNLCEARQRLGVEPVRRVFDSVARPLAVSTTPGAFYKGLRLMGIDGTVLDAPDTPANNERFHRSSGGRGDGAFPQVRKVSLVELGTHVEVALAFGGWQHSEQTLVARLWDRIPADALLLEDRGFFSYNHWKTLDSRGVQLLVRMKNNLILEPLGEHLPDRSYLAKIYPTSYAREKDRDGIVVRVIEYTLDDPQRTGHRQTHRLVTNLFDPARFPALELICNYHERWEVELVFDEQKTHLDPRRASKPAHFRSQTPEGVEQELYALSLGHFVVRALMVEAAKEDNLDVDQLSFTGSLHTLQARLPECDSSTAASLEKWYRVLLAEVAQERTEPRRNRVNPRVVKRKMSKFAKKRQEHRHQPPLKKTFAETVVVT